MVLNLCNLRPISDCVKISEDHLPNYMKKKYNKTQQIERKISFKFCFQISITAIMNPKLTYSRSYFITTGFEAFTGNGLSSHHFFYFESKRFCVRAQGGTLAS